MNYVHRIVFAALAVAVQAFAKAADTWPEVASPSGAQVHAVASDMILNGRQSKVYRFEVQGSEKEVAAFFREQFGKQVVENRLKSDFVIATRQGDYFHTVQLHAVAPQVMQGTVMTTHLSAKPVVTQITLDTSKTLPPETMVVTTMQSEDDSGKRSLMMIGVNQNSIRANRDHLLNAMQQRGFRLVREDTPPEGPERALALTLSSTTEEASVTIADAGGYRTVLINRLKESR